MECSEPFRWTGEGHSAGRPIGRPVGCGTLSAEKSVLYIGYFKCEAQYAVVKCPRGEC